MALLVALPACDLEPSDGQTPESDAETDTQAHETAATLTVEGSQPAAYGFSLLPYCGDGYCDPWEINFCYQDCDLQCGCEGIECGYNPCGQLCDNCPAGLACTASGCTCAPSCDDKVCGDDGCGGSCGQCAAGDFCTQQGQCEAGCGCGDQECGVGPCGESCGTCPQWSWCSADGQCQYWWWNL